MSAFRQAHHFPLPGVDEEKIKFFIRRHWASMLGTIILIIFMIILPPSLVTIFLYNSNIEINSIIRLALILTGSIYYLMIASFSLVQWISYYYNVFIITEDEIIDIVQQGIFNRQINQISIVRIQDVSGEIKGILPTLFTYGNVVAESAGEKTQTYIIENIPNPMEVADRILELHNEEVLREARKRQFLTAEGDLSSSVVPKPGRIIQKLRQNDIPPTPPASPPTTSSVSSPPSSSPPPPQNQNPPAQNTQGDISKDDLNKGGEVKF